VEARHLARFKKKALTEDRILVFVDESGLSQKPHRVRTWAPRGQTPVLEFDFNWEKLSVMAGITVWNFYFRLYPGSMKSPQVIDFLQHLQTHLSGKLLIVWDGATIHRSRQIRDYLDGLKGKLYLAQLPAYAPELNPAEYIWGYFKQHRLPNLCARDLAELSAFGRKALKNMRRRPKLISAFWKQAELW
jgi:transposase